MPRRTAFCYRVREKCRLTATSPVRPRREIAGCSFSCAFRSVITEERAFAALEIHAFPRTVSSYIVSVRIRFNSEFELRCEVCFDTHALSIGEVLPRTPRDLCGISASGNLPEICAGILLHTPS